MEVNVSEPEMNDYGKAQFATEVAFNALVKQAKDMGLEVAPVMGLMYLPTQELTRNFQQACKAILTALGQPSVTMQPPKPTMNSFQRVVSDERGRDSIVTVGGNN